MTERQFNFQPFGVRLEPGPGFVDSDHEFVVTCEVCDTDFIEVSWNYQEAAADICPRCSYGSSNRVRGMGFKPWWSFIAGGNNKTGVISWDDWKYVDQLELAISLLNKEIKCNTSAK